MPPRRRSDRDLCRRLLRDDGQTFVFIATMLFGLLVVVGTVINVGQAVNRRIFLQMAADAGAYTGATEMARGMNTMAEHNARIQRGWQRINKVLSKWYVPCAISQFGVQSFKALQGWESEIINAVNNGYGRRALSEARRVSEYNSGDLFPARPSGTERVTFQEGDSGLGLGAQRPADYVVWTEQVPEGTAPKASGGPGAKKSVSYECINPPSPARVRKRASFGLWFRKTKGTDPVAFVWVAKSPATRARFFDDVFGPNLIPEMTAVAVAKPVGGDLEKGESRYVAKIIPVRDLLSGVTDRWNNRWRSMVH